MKVEVKKILLENYKKFPSKRFLAETEKENPHYRTHIWTF